MKKIVFVCEYPFTEHNSFKMEIKDLRSRGINIEINDLSQIIYGKNFSSHWKTKLETKTLKFCSLLEWFAYFRKLDKKETIFWNNIKAFNLNGFIIELILRTGNLIVIQHFFFDIFSTTQKKTFKFIIDRIRYHRLNIWPYLYFLKIKIYKFFLNLFPFKKVYFLSNNFDSVMKVSKDVSKSHKVDFNSYDYSNYLLFKQDFGKNEKKYAIYIDGGGPYFSGDRLLNKTKKDECDHEKYYGALNNFFKDLENKFKLDVYVVPHPKYKSDKGISLNPFFSKEKVINDYDALPKLSSNCEFFINYNSTAQSFAVASNKPTILFYSSKYFKEAPSIKLSREILAKKLKISPIDICNYNLNEIKKILKINDTQYKKYKFDYLTPKSRSVENITNSEILSKLVQKI